jgi:negative regulator of sigma E activity
MNLKQAKKLLQKLKEEGRKTGYAEAMQTDVEHAAYMENYWHVKKEEREKEFIQYMDENTRDVIEEV